MISIMLMLGLTASMSIAKTPSRMTLQDCWSIFPAATAFEKATALGPDVMCAKVLQVEPPEQILGYVFHKSLQSEGGTIEVLVGVTNAGAISIVKAKGIGIEEEFLAQFRGKTSRDDFELARAPEDLLFVPVKIKAMKTNLALAESIAQGMKEILLSADRVTR
ncbi:MAG: hypothetical protein ACREOO_06580 [bacterium]